MKKEKAETKANIENLSKVIENNKKIPKNIKDKINAKRFENIIFGIVILFYLVALNLGKTNIPTENYLLDLRVFSILFLFATIILFEIAYKKDKSDLWLHGAELMAVMIFTTYLIYLYSIYYNTFQSIVFLVATVFFIYYVVKIIIMKKRIIKEYNKSLVDIGEIVKK